MVWAQLLSGYGALLLVSAAIVAVETHFPSWWPVTLLVGSVLYGYGVAFIHLFIHEAAHFNLARGRKWNDRLANVFVGLLIGQDIGRYRDVHFDHHRHLGTTRDTEHSYFHPLTPSFILKSLLGTRALEVFRRREELLQRGRKDSHPRPPVLLLGLMLHASLISAALLLSWTLAAVWLLAMAGTFPFFASLRQLLEHRSEHASADVDYHALAHGPVNRLFGDGPIANTFGAAGFNRHLIHHWEPQVSCTRLRELEDFLRETELASALAASQTTYVATFRRLFSAG